MSVLNSVSLLVDCNGLWAGVGNTLTMVEVVQGSNVERAADFSANGVNVGQSVASAAVIRDALVAAINGAATVINGATTKAVAIGDYVMVSSVSRYVPDPTYTGVKTGGSHGAAAAGLGTAGVQSVVYTPVITDTTLKGDVLAAYNAGYSARSSGL